MRRHKIQAVAILENDSEIIQGLTEHVNAEFNRKMFEMKYMSGFMT